MSPSNVLYVLGSESSGKSSVIHRILEMANRQIYAAPPKARPTTGQDVHSCFLRDNVPLEIRELGGSMAPFWDQFIQSSCKHDKGAHHALVYVVDATAPHQLSESTTRFLQLVNISNSFHTQWPVQVVLHKIHSPNAVTKEDLLLILGGVHPPVILEVDAWTGFGVGDMFRWLRDVAFVT